MSGRSASGAGRSVLVYAVTTARPGLGRLIGIGGEPLQLALAGELAAIIGEPPRVPRPARAALVRYATVVEGAARRRAALLPVRYGTTMTREALTFALTARRQALRAGLRAVRHRVQMNVHVTTDPRKAVAASAGRSRRAGRGPAGRVSGTQYLRARLDAAMREEEVPGFEPVRDAVRRWTRGERVERRNGQTVVCHLVPRASVAGYRRAIERTAGQQGLQVHVTGPWAAYAFADGW